MSDEKHFSIQRKALETKIAAANAVQKKSDASVLADNRPGTVAQLASKVTNHFQAYNYGAGKVNVGKSMEAWLDPKNPMRGQSANLNTSQDDMMTAIRDYWDISGGDLVKGHLLNDNLGGSALNINLYPITRAANKDHLMYVENMVKNVVWNEESGIHYGVKVSGTPNYKQAKATFETWAEYWNPKTNKTGKFIGYVNVPSDLNDVKGYHQAYNPKKPKEDIDTYGNPKKPSSVQKPKTKVTELTKQEKQDRMDQD
jgi:hypothetical protein